MKKYMILLVIIVLLFVGYYALSPLLSKKVVNEESPLNVTNDSNSNGTSSVTTTTTVTTTTDTNSNVPHVVTQGTFKSDAHNVSGTTLIIQTGDAKILRMENFNTVNGPDLKVYLATDKSASDFVDLGSLKATSGNLNYDIPAGTDTTKYHYVLIWCKDFKILFGSAVLN